MKKENHLDPVRALRIINGLVLELSDENKLLGTIYMISHQAGSPHCTKNHPNWTEEALETERQLVEAMIIPKWEGK